MRASLQPGDPRRHRATGWARGALEGAAVAARGLATPAAAKLAIETGIAVGLSVWLATEAGLEDPYWAGISAVVVMSPTLGASLGASLSRILGTLLGLGLGLAAVEAFGQGYVVAGIVAGLVVLLLPALRLEASARLGAATSLLVTIVPGSDVLSTALARGANVPLGCAVSIVVGAVLWPSRAGRSFRERLESDVDAALRTAAESFAAYAAGRSPGEPLLSPGARAARATLLRDAERELLSSRRRTAWEQASSAVSDLTHAALELHAIAREGAGDGVHVLVADDVSRVAEALLATCERRAGGRAAWSGGVRAAVEQLRRGVEDDRAARRMLPYPTDELMRLLAFVREAETIARVLGELEAHGESALGGPAVSENESLARPAESRGSETFGTTPRGRERP